MLVSAFRTLLAKWSLIAVTGSIVPSIHIRSCEYDASIDAKIHICQGEYVLYTRCMATSRIDGLQDLMMALADTTRLRLLSMMRSREICVCFFTAVIDAPQPTISRHLAYLRGKGLVEARREGKWMHYRMAQPKGASLARA